MDERARMMIEPTSFIIGFVAAGALAGLAARNPFFVLPAALAAVVLLQAQHPHEPRQSGQARRAGGKDRDRGGPARRRRCCVDRLFHHCAGNAAHRDSCA
jgi:hypothetical protein